MISAFGTLYGTLLNSNSLLVKAFAFFWLVVLIWQCLYLLVVAANVLDFSMTVFDTFFAVVGGIWSGLSALFTTGNVKKTASENIEKDAVTFISSVASEIIKPFFVDPVPSAVDKSSSGLLKQMSNNWMPYPSHTVVGAGVFV
jgi:hypothetical protein